MLLPVLVFLSVSFGVGAVLLWVTPTRAEQRLRDATRGPEAPAHWSEAVVKVVGPFAGLATPEGRWEDSPLRLRFLRAGLRHRDAHLLYFGAKFLLPLVLAAAAFFMLNGLADAVGLALLWYVLAVALAGCYLPNLLLAWRLRLRQREIFENFPDAADLMTVCVEAGLGLDAALARVADEMRRKSVPLAEELHLAVLEMRAGGTRAQALRNLALRTGLEETATFATMLTQADRFGTSVGESLRVFADDLRHKRQVRAEERAARLPTKMLLPLVLCIFPSVIMVILGPAVIQILRTLLPLIAGQP
ncbi:MAG TPA: type II secretion system F family protein [Ramlibacter sp.]